MEQTSSKKTKFEILEFYSIECNKMIVVGVTIIRNGARLAE